MPALLLTPPADWPTLGNDLVDWIETYLVHGPGDVEGEPIELDTEAIIFLQDAYRLYPKGHAREGRRVVFDATYSRPKGRAKSELAGMISCAEACGPVRFGRWDGDTPVGVPVRAPFIRCLATEEGQAGNTYDNVETMLTHAVETHPKVFAGIEVGKTRTLIGQSGEIRPSSSGAASKDGGKETFAVADEVHLYVLPEHKQMLKTVRRNLRKRKAAQPWFMSTTTMYRPGQGSVAEGRHEAARKSAGSKRRDLSVLFDHREAPTIENWESDKELLAALADVYGDFAEHMDLEGILQEIRDPETDQSEGQRYFLNQRADHFDTAFSIDQFDGMVSDATVEDGDLIVGGFDGARFDDSTALVARSITTGHRWIVGLWEHDGTDDWEVDEDDVTEAVAGMFERFEVWRVYCDPPYWESAISRWQGIHGDQRVIDWHTNRNKAMAYAVRNFSVALKTGDGTFSADDNYRRHIGNCYRRDLPRLRDENGKPLWTVGKERAGSPRKIDAAVAGIICDEAFNDAIAANVKKKRRTRMRTYF